MAKKVLIVEDTFDIADALQELIQLQGYVAIVARSGLEGVELAEREKPDLILMDVSMPDINGYDATQAIRARDTVTPIVAVTSYAEGHEDELLQAGCNEVFNKSAFIALFVPTLRKYLE